MRKLYEIQKEIEELIQNGIDPETGELVIDEAMLGLLQLEKEQKIESVALYYKDTVAELDAVLNEIKKLEQRADRLANTRDGLKTYLSTALKGEKFTTPRCEVSSRKSVSVELADDFVYWATINGKYNLINHKETDTPDKTKIKELLKSGGNLGDKARLVEKTNIIIK